MRTILLASAALLGLAAGPALAAGNDNQVFIYQTGEGNTSSQLQDTGSNNKATANIYFSDNNNTAQEQTGNFGTLEIYTEGQGGNTTVQKQGGTSNFGRTTQVNSRNSKAEIYQTNGNNNRTEQSQTGFTHAAKSEQDGGNNNTVNQNQGGNNHVAYAYQGGGSSSTITQNQTGSYHVADSRQYATANGALEIGQTGYNNKAYQQQSGDRNTGRTFQNGTNNTAYQTQR